jgi:hypothetical protein
MKKLMLLPLVLLSACASMPGSEWTVADGERAVRNKLSYLQGVEMRDTFVSTDTSSLKRMCGYINVQSDSNSRSRIFTVRPEFIRFAYIFERDQLGTEYHAGFGLMVSYCVKPGQKASVGVKSEEVVRAEAARVQAEEAKKAERVRSGGW